MFDKEWLKEGLFEEEFKPDNKGITELYPKNKRKELFKIIFEEHDKSVNKGLTSGTHISVGTGRNWCFSEDANKYAQDLETYDYPFNKFFLCEGFPIFEKPLDEMPLYINDEEYKVRAVAKWRLSFGGKKYD